MKKWILFFSVAAIWTACSQSGNNQLPASEPDETSEDLIVGGHNVTKKSDIVATTVSLVNTEEGTLCTASILSSEVALTAAHCISANTEFMQISFGLKTESEETRPVIAAVVSPLWNNHQDEKINNGDMALIHFSGGLPKGASAATLMKSSHHLSNGEIVTLAGFGISNAKSDSGAGRLRTVDVKIANVRFSTTEVSLDQTNKHGACHGDSGGPAFIQDNNGGLLLWGVTSRGINDPSDLCRGQSIYTRIQPYARWINSVIRNWKQ